MNSIKRIIALLLCVIMTAGLVACGDSETESTAADTTSASAASEQDAEGTTGAETTTQGVREPTTASDFTAFGIIFGSLTAAELQEIIPELVDDYSIQLTIDGYTFSLTGAAVDLSLPEDLDYNSLVDGTMTAEQLEGSLTIGDDTVIKQAMVNAYHTYLQYILTQAEANKESEGTAAAEGTEAEMAAALTDEEIAAIEEIIAGGTKVAGAHIEFDKETKTYIGVDGEEGEIRNYDKAVAGLKQAMLDMEDEYEVVYEMETTEAELAEGNEKVAAAVAEANTYLEVCIVYNFVSPDRMNAHYTLESPEIADYLMVAEDGLTIQVDEEALSTLCSRLVTKYSDVKTVKETIGNQLVITNTGWTTDVNVIYKNIKEAIEQKKTRIDFNAEFTEVNETLTEDLKSEVYVYANLDEQMVYLYENGEIIYSTPCVSGKVAEEEGGAQHCTPTGSYEIYDMETNRYLQGTNSDGTKYKSFVRYWMPFCGNVGMHDADWRSTFGGDIYYWGGSHGCLNLPVEAAEYIYNHVTIGTKVIVTGGIQTAPSSDQVITYPTYTDKTIGDPTFNLGATCLGGAKLTYESSDESIATVDEDGNVTMHTKGAVYITITSQLCMQYWSRSVVAEVYVHGKPHDIQVSTTSYDLSPGAGTFNLYAECPTAGTGGINYSSEDTSVCTVDDDGNVTITGTGSTNVVIFVGGTPIYNATRVYIKINVGEPSTQSTTEAATEATTEASTEASTEATSASE